MLRINKDGGVIGWVTAGCANARIEGGELILNALGGARCSDSERK